MNSPRLGWAGLLAAVVLVLTGCGKEKAPTQSKLLPIIEGERITFPGDSAPPGLSLAQVQEGDGHVLRVPGRLVWDEDRTVRVFSPFAGRVAQIFVQPGREVTVGQPLAAIDSPDFGAAQAEFQKASADLALAQKKLDRVKALEEHGVAARKELDEAQDSYADAEAEMERTRSRVKLYGAPAHSVDQRFFLNSPLAGVVVQKSINPGQELRAEHSDMPLFVVTDPTALWAQLDANESDLAGLQQGYEVTLTSHQYPEERFSGSILHVADYVDPVTRTVKIQVKVPNADRKLKAEMYVTAEIPFKSAPKPLVTARAVVFYGGRYFVFVVQGNNAYVRREVKLGAEDQGAAHVLAGLAPGESVVVEGALYLQQLLQSTSKRP